MNYATATYIPLKKGLSQQVNAPLELVLIEECAEGARLSSQREEVVLRGLRPGHKHRHSELHLWCCSRGNASHSSRLSCHEKTAMDG